MRLVDFRRVASLALVMATAPAMAGLFSDAPEGGYPELPVQPAPSFNADKTIAIDLRPGSGIALGIDPATITVESDGIVRYVAVARSTGGTAVTAMYEGVRCSTAEVKVYARSYGDGAWRPVDEPKWQSLYDAGPSRTSLPIARAGVCQDASSGGTPRKIVQNLSNDVLRTSP